MRAEELFYALWNNTDSSRCSTDKSRSAGPLYLLEDGLVDWLKAIGP